MNTPETTTPDTQRTENGRFRKGNRGGPGNPFTRQCAKLRQAAQNAVTEEEMREIIGALKKKALEGDVAAIKLLLSYTIGKPTGATNPDTVDKDELHSLLEYYTGNSETVLRILNGVPADFVLQMLQAILPGLLESQLKQSRQQAAAEEAEPEGPPIVSDGVAPGLEKIANPPPKEEQGGKSLNLEAVERQLHELLQRGRQKPDASSVRKGDRQRGVKERMGSPIANGKH